MQATWSQHNWFENNSSISRHIIAFGFSVVLLVLLLMIPYQLNIDTKQYTSTIAVDLIKEKPIVESQIVQTVDETVKEEVVEEVAEKIVKTIEESTPETQPKVTQAVAKPIKLNPQTIKETPPLPSAGTILNTAYGKVKLHQISKDFQVATEDYEDFKFKTIQQPKWNQVTKLIDEELDKPRVVMDFYSAGIVGSTERFFDKITYKKKFTTRYGTKIYCGGVGPLIMCSW